MRFPVRTLLALVALVPSFGTVSPASAIPPAPGVVTFVADFQANDTFPCSTGCSATINSLVAAGAVGNTRGIGVVAGIGTDYLYHSEVCTAGQALQGTAGGRLVLTGPNVTGALLPMAVTVQMEWVGLVAVFMPSFIGVSDLVGAAVFVPTRGLPTCTGGSFFEALVAGAFVVIGNVP